MKHDDERMGAYHDASGHSSDRPTEGETVGVGVAPSERDALALLLGVGEDVEVDIGVSLGVGVGTEVDDGDRGTAITHTATRPATLPGYMEPRLP